MQSKYNGYSFPLRESVQREKVRFHNRYVIDVFEDRHLTRGAGSTLAAVAM